MITFVMKEQCETCIFRPGNPMHLEEGRLQAMINQTDADDTNVVCHQSAGLKGAIRCEAWCRGSVDRKPGQAVRMMRDLGILEELDINLYNQLILAFSHKDQKSWVSQIV